MRAEISNADAVQMFAEQDQDYKLELLAELDPVVSIYRQGEFVDLCRGPPHLESTAQVKHFKLQNIAGAYWRGVILSGPCCSASTALPF